MALETSPPGTYVELLGGRRLLLDLEAPLDERIGLTAARQHDVISVAQLRCCGLSARAARGRQRSGRLRRVHHGVYALSHARLPALSEVAAALLACGLDASASHRTAAWMRKLRDEVRRTIDVTGGSRTGLRHHHVVVHRGTQLRPGDVTLVDDLPVTSLARTLLDCAPILGRRGTEKLVREAEYRDELDVDAVCDLLSHAGRHPGRGILRAALGDGLDETKGRTASPPEDRLLDAFREWGLSEFECNPPLELDDGTVVYPDFLFRAERLVVEVDPRSSHDRTSSYRSDRRRDRALKRTQTWTRCGSATRTCATRWPARLRSPNGSRVSCSGYVPHRYVCGAAALLDAAQPQVRA